MVLFADKAELCCLKSDTCGSPLKPTRFKQTAQQVRHQSVLQRLTWAAAGI